MRSNNRSNDRLRPIIIENNIQPQADASLMIKMGNTHVLCAVTVEDKAPPFLQDTGKGWITAEYAMLPCATNSRIRRESVQGRSGRTYEIQRLIGRSLRMMVDLSSFGERTIRVDCDVINADGGTRTASITGASLAVRNALRNAAQKGIIEMPTILPVAAISVGIVGGEVLLDLDYQEDSSAEVDANYVMTGDGRLVEVQGTAEGQPFTIDQFGQLTAMAQNGIDQLLTLWQGEK
ncbi:MAG: ribonuclease PH [Proteobacteria bacterium]|nr:ribonuclease PH [Pseudomonadota bacterium]MBU1708749.1 ribonuclease PH [Pseudomonadota bacterium]